MIHWLILNVWPSVLRTAVSAVTGAIVAVMIIAPLKGALRHARKRFSAVIDSLDPEVPVGLTEQLDDVHAQLRTLNQHVAGTLNVRTAPPLPKPPPVKR